MKKEFFNDLEKILYEENLEKKFSKFENFYQNFKSEKFVFNMEQASIFKENLNQNISFTHPTRIRRPKFTNSTKALAKVIHSITHIEFCAINLALDTSYRFKNLPYEFYKDWLEVADEEIKHFKLLNSILEELGFKYSDFCVHNNLELALKATKDSLNFRVGVVHRGLEAKGLDANPFVIKKLESSTHKSKTLLKEILAIILNDEIKHVKKGDFWWKFSKKEGEDFLSLCEKFKDFSLAGKTLNIKARLEAGFDEKECESIAKFYQN